MTQIQLQIKNALLAMGERSKFTDAILAKKLRETAKIDGKKKAVIALADLVEACGELASEGKIFSITITTANDLVIERTDELKEIPLEQKQRRQKHEKSQQIFTNGDLNNKAGSNSTHKKIKENHRTSRTSININSNFEDS